MSDKQEYIEFRRLLRQAIGPYRTQTEFAAKAGITPQHLNRMLNSETISRPTKETLMKISGCSRGGIPLQAFLEACGYEPTTDIEKELGKLSVKERVIRCVDLLKKGMKELTGIYDGIYSFVDTVLTIYGEEDISFSIGMADSLKAGEHGLAEKASIVTFSWDMGKAMAEFDVVVYYCETTGGSVAVIEVATDQKTLSEFYSHVVDKIKELDQYKEDGTACVIIGKTPEKPGKKPLMVEEKLLQAIFGDDRPRIPISIEGLGFSIINVSDATLRRFLRKHKQSFCKSEAEQKIFDDYVNGKQRRLEAFHTYKTDTGVAGSNYFGAAIANIIFRERNIRVSCWEDHANMFGFGDSAYIMLEDRPPWKYNETEKTLSEETLASILDKYAHELRVEVEDCRFLMYISGELYKN